MGCACCSNIDVYDIVNGSPLHVVEIRGVRSMKEVCELSGAVSLYHLSRNDEKGVNVIVSPIAPPVRLVRHITTKSRSKKFECPFCYGVFNTSLIMREHLKVCVLYLSGTIIERGT